MSSVLIWWRSRIRFCGLALGVVDFLLSSLGEDGLGGRLMLEYQKSLPAQSILTQTANSSDGEPKIHP
jgi:hypothetical protein